jgi:hypothetical protein
MNGDSSGGGGHAHGHSEAITSEHTAPARPDSPLDTDVDEWRATAEMPSAGVRAAPQMLSVRRRHNFGQTVGDQLVVAVHDAYLQVGRTVIERSLTRANIVLTGATAAVTAYTALLGLVYSASHGRSSPATALLPVPYLGLAIALTAFYSGYLAPRGRRFHPLPVGSSRDVAEERLARFLSWVVGTTMARAWALRVATVSLGLGLALLPVGFIALHGVLAVLVKTVPGALLLGFGGFEAWRWLGNGARSVIEEDVAEDEDQGPILPRMPAAPGPQMPDPWL